MNRHSGDTREKVLICSWLEEELVSQIRGLDDCLQVEFHPDLLPQPRYPGDHTGAPAERSTAGERRWRGLLAEATILYDFDRSHLDDLPEVAARVKWIQATSAGIGQLMRKHRFAERMPDTVFTTASGVHRRPLAEFVAMALTLHSRRALEMIHAQRACRWERFAGTDLEGRTLLIVGLGKIGEAVALMATTLGMCVVGIRRDPARSCNRCVDELYAPDQLESLLPRAEFLVLVAPLTEQTQGMLGRSQLALLPPGAAVINIGRGALIDEVALIDSLQSGHLGGAYLDVFAKEPLPLDSPLWTVPNVLVSPHSSSTSDRENARLTQLFCNNLRLHLAGQPLQNLYDPDRGY